MSLWKNVVCTACVATSAVLLAACDQKPPTWDSLITAKIVQEYPTYQVMPQPGGGLTVERPGLSPHAVDVDGIARFCQRGPKDCDYAVDQLLLELQPPAQAK